MPQNNMITLAERTKRLLQNIEIVDGPLNTCCWKWVGGTNIDGYGRLSTIHNKVELAHRVSYKTFIGPILTSLNVCHRCDNRWCINPLHLFIGSQQDNIADMITKGRHVAPEGERNGRAKLSGQQARQIKERLRNGEPAAELAREFNVPYNLVFKIKIGQTWKLL